MTTADEIRTGLEDYSDAQVARKAQVASDWLNSDGRTMRSYAIARSDLYRARLEQRRRRDIGRVPTTCVEHAYGASERLSFQIKVF